MGQKFNPEEVSLILSGAEALHTKEFHKEPIAGLVDEQGKTELEISDLYTMAGVLRIPPEYIDAYISNHFPNGEIQLRDLEKQGALADIRVVERTYKKELLRALNSTSPTDSFRTGKLTARHDVHPGVVFYRSTLEDTLQKKWFGLSKKIVTENKMDRLASFLFTSDTQGDIPPGKFSLGVHLEDPFFLRACGETMEGLRERFNDQIEDYLVKYNYHVD